MTYSERDIHGSGACLPAVLRAAIVDRGKKLAGMYAPGGIYREPPVGVEGWIIDECTRIPGFEIDPDGVTVQINEETAGMQSAFWVERANPGGIGAVDHNPGQAIDFTVDEQGNRLSFEEGARRGIRAHVAKLRNYRFGEGPWTAEDPRAPAVRGKGWMGTCRTWGDLQGKWATSPTYAASIEAIWTRMTIIRLNMGGTVAGQYEHVVPGLVDLRPMLKRNPNGGSEGRLPLQQKRGVVIHFNGPDVGANDREQIINVAAYHCTKDFSSNGSGAIGDGIMYHLAIADDGTAYLTRDLEDGLWHCGHAWNRHAFAIYVPIGINQRATPVQLQRLAEVSAALLRFTGEGLDALKGHLELSSTNCPGSLMPDFVRPFRAGAFSVGKPLPPVVEPVPQVPASQPDPWRFDAAARNYAATWNGGEAFWILNPFVDWIHGHGGLLAIGYAVSGAFVEDGLLVQYFEGGRLEWHPGHAAEYRVLRGHTGLEVIRDRHPERVPAGVLRP